jgi:hypothetical protein
LILQALLWLKRARQSHRCHLHRTSWITAACRLDKLDTAWLVKCCSRMWCYVMQPQGSTIIHNDSTSCLWQGLVCCYQQASISAAQEGSSQNMYIPVENVAINAIKCNAFMYRLSSALKSLKSCDWWLDGLMARSSVKSVVWDAWCPG